MEFSKLLKKFYSRRLSFWDILEFELRFPWLIICILILITLVLGFQIPNLSIKTSIYDLVIEDLKETKYYHKFKKEFDSDEIIQIVIKSDNIFDPATFAEIALISEKTSKIKGIKRVISLPVIKKIVDIADSWDMNKFEKLLTPVQLFHNNLISKNNKATAITLVLDNNIKPQTIIDEIKKIIQKSPKELYIYQIGMPLLSESLEKFTKSDFVRLLPVSFILICVILFCLFRKSSCLILPILCITLTLIWTFGFMALMKIPLSMLTMIVPVFLIAIVTAYCLYINSEYLVQITKAKSSYEAVFTTFLHITFPTALAILTTFTGLASLFISQITTIREFAIFSCVGILSALFIILSLYPSFLVLFTIEPKQKIYFLSKLRDLIQSGISNFIDIIIKINLKYQKASFSIILALIIFCIIGMFRIKVETNPMGYFKKDTQISQNFHNIYKDLSGSFPINLIMEGHREDYFEDPDNLAKIDKVQKFLKTLPGVDKTISFADYIQLVNYGSNQYNQGYYVLPQEQYEISMLINNYKIMLGNDMLKRFMSDDLSKANILMLTHISSSRDFLETREKIMKFVKENFADDIKWNVTGFGIILSMSSHYLINGQLKSFAITMSVIFCIMFLLFLSSKVGMIALLTNMFPIIINFGLMGWLGIELSMATSLIASIAIGLAVDDTIHYLVRYNREFKKDLDKDRALSDTLKTVGKPIIFTTITISIGFFVLILSNFEPTSDFGFLMLIIMIAALIGDLIILPSVMLHIELVTAWDLLRLMPSLSGMSAGLAHELNQPLNAIKMGSEFLRMMVNHGEKIPTEHLAMVADEISEQIDRASDIINRLRALEQKTNFTKDRIDVNKPIKDTLTIIGNQLILDNIEYRLDLSDSLPPVIAHTNRLSQVIFNLVTNADEAIKARQKETDQKMSISIKTFQGKNKVVIIVQDTGIGIPESIKHRILEPFFTTKKIGQGKGLGLSISNEIIRDFRGKIHIKSKRRKGTTVKIEIPAVS